MRENRPSGSEGGAILIQSSLPLLLFNRFAVAHLIGRARAKSGEESDSPAL